MSILSSSLSRIKPSPTIAVTQKARELKEKGVDVISLGAGEPDFDTPNNVKNAAIEAIHNGETKYTAVDGTPKLKEAIINKFKRENGLTFTKDQINVGAGGKQVIFNAILSTINPGDEVLIPAPYWVSYPDIVLLAGGVPKIVVCSEKDKFKITPKKVKENLTDKTKWIILNSPSNPTGSCYSKNEIDAIADLLKDYPKVMIMSDDIYEHVVYDDFEFYTIAQNKSVTERTLTINGVSNFITHTGSVGSHTGAMISPFTISFHNEHGHSGSSCAFMIFDNPNTTDEITYTPTVLYSGGNQDITFKLNSVIETDDGSNIERFRSSFSANDDYYETYLLENPPPAIPSNGVLNSNSSQLNKNTAHIRGVKKIKGMDLVGSDLRSSAALIIAGIVAKGTSKIYGLEHLDRGYENFESKLKILGIKITREFSKKTLTNKEFKNSSDPADIPRYRAA